ncbi:hypothetical protein [Prochlorococcus marinus]|uniref:hypothetical protein n=1 Tax=Prochlorococcus marinus TaxID=1219 RepID=UPI0012DA7C68|nr:hypothetical protein [Prochlorococcus marinus]
MKQQVRGDVYGKACIRKTYSGHGENHSPRVERKWLMAVVAQLRSDVGYQYA